MLYDNKALTTLPVKTTVWKGGWEEGVIFKKNGGVGLIIEGRIRGKSRHNIVVGNSHNRYLTLHVEVVKATKRRFDQHGKEIEPDFGSHKKVNTGYLSSSYKTVQKEGDDIISAAKCVDLLKLTELFNLNREKLTNLNFVNLTSIWCAEKELEGRELDDGASVRLRTKGDGPYLESIVCLDEEKISKTSYSTGETVGGSWTDKVLNVKDEKEKGSHLTEDSKAIDDDEWEE